MRRRKQRALAVVVLLAFALGAGLWQAWLRVTREPADPQEASARAVAAANAASATAAASRQEPREYTAPGASGDAPEAALHGEPQRGDEGGTRGRRLLGSASDRGGPRAIYIDARNPPRGLLSSPVQGLDTGAPRRLVLWRLEDGRRVRVADGWSDADGRLHFPEVLVPERPLPLVVTAADEGPHGLDRSAPDVVQTNELRPPQARAGRDAEGVARLRVTASRSLGALVVADGRGAELARAELAPLPLPGRRVVELALPSDASGPFQVAQELPDGSRSAWATVEAPAPGP